MATITVYAGDISLVSKWTVVFGGSSYIMSPGPSTALGTLTFSLAGLPAGATITNATLYSDLNSPLTGAALRQIDGSVFSGSRDVTSKVTGAGTSVSFALAFRANGTASTPAGQRSSAQQFWNNRIVITYTEPAGGTTPGTGTGPFGTISADKSTMDFGGAVKMTLTGVPNRWHRLAWSCLGNSDSIVIGTGYGYVWNVATALAWMNSIPNATSANMVFTLTGFDVSDNNGSNPLGTRTVTVKLTVPANVVPTFTGFTATRVANGVPAAITNYVQGYSKVTLAVTGAAGAYGSTVSSYSIVGGGFSSALSSVTFGVLKNAGEVTFSATVTDSRGRKRTGTVSIAVLDYAKPTLSGAAAYRAASDGTKANDGTYARLFANAVFSALEGENTATLSGRIYPRGGTPGEWTTMTSGTAWVTGGGALSITTTYIAEIRVSDLLNAYTLTVVIPTDSVGLNIRDGATGAAVGKYAEEDNVFESAWPIKVAGENVALAAYPVGAIYISVSSTDPGTLFGGTWAALGGRFLIAANSTYTAGSTGGEAAVTLTKAQLPDTQLSVNFSYSFATVASGTNYSYVPHSLTFDNNPNLKTKALGSGEKHNNLPPYLAVYMWKRTA